LYYFLIVLLFSVFDCLKKFDLSLYIDKITAVKDKIHNSTNFKNIIDDSLIGFSRNNLNEIFVSYLQKIKSDYDNLMLKTKKEFEEYMDIFNNVKTVNKGVVRVVQQHHHPGKNNS
jgi:hypothetical protein